MNNTPSNVWSVSTGTFIRFFAVLALCYFVYFIRDILLVILTSIVIASAVEPGTKWFIRHKIPRVPAVLLIYLGATTLLVGSVYFFLIPLVSDSANFLTSLPVYTEALNQSTSAATQTGGFLGGLSDNLSLPSLVGQINTALAHLSSGFFGTIDVIFGGILSFLLIIVLSFYLAMQEDGVGNFLRVVAPVQYEQYIIDLWRRSKEKIGLWMQGQVLLAFLVAVLAYLGLTLIGVRQALVLAFLAGLFEIIPLFGAFLSAVPAVLIASIDGGLSLGLIVAGLFLIIQQFESQLIYPLVVKKVVGVPPIISILALVIGAKLAGFLGILLSVPLAAVMMELLNDYEKGKRKELSL